MNRLLRHPKVTLGVFFLLTASVVGQQPVSIAYTVEVRRPETKLFYVTTHVKHIDQPTFEFSLPVWTPGWYTVEDYAKNILRLKITDERGTRLAYRRTRKQTWSVETAGQDEVKVEFEYRAETLALNQAKIADDFAFLTGTQIFLAPDRYRASPSTVRFVVPKNWKIVSALKETAEQNTFAAPDYDTLVDAPTEMGRFDVARFEVEGKPHYFVATPAGAFSGEKTREMTRMLARVASAQGAIFGGLPYEKYVYFYFFATPESNAGGALEHANSHVAFAPPVNATPARLIGTASHEFFHLWNVKRIRPAEMWPYDYSRADETPLLWVAEGFTNYYGDLAVYRAGLSDRARYLRGLAATIADVEGNEARSYLSPAETSVATWLGYDTPVAFDISYYAQGANLAALLDLSIRHDSEGQHSLDDVMRVLDRDFYGQQKGYTTEDLIGVINRLTGGDYGDFFRRYVWGVEVPPYEKIYGYAGYTLNRPKDDKPFELIELPNATAQQLKIREAWLKVKETG